MQATDAEERDDARGTLVLILHLGDVTSASLVTLTSAGMRATEVEGCNRIRHLLNIRAA